MKRGLLAVVALAVLLGGVAVADHLGSSQVTGDTAVEQARPVQYPPGRLDTPPSAPEGINPVAVPSVVRAPGAEYHFVGERVEGLTCEVPSPAKTRPRPNARKVEDPAGTTNPDATAPAKATPRADREYAPPGLSVSFDTNDFDTNSANNGGYIFIPPDCHGAAGINHLVNIVNCTVRIHDKTGGGPFLDTSLAAFFAPLVPLTFTYDPKVLYDQYEDRFVIVDLEFTDTGNGDPADTSRIFVAVSDDGDPQGTWYMTQINSAITISNPCWADYPGFAVDEEAVYITTNMYEFSAYGGNWRGMRLWVIDKGVSGGFYGGGAATVSLYDPAGPLGLFSNTQQPAHVYGTAPAGEGTLLSMYSRLSDGTNEYLQVIRVQNPIPGPATFTGGYFMVGDFDDTTGVPTLIDAPQSGSAYTIEVNDRRTLDAVWRDNSLWLTTTIAPGSGPDAGQTTAYWFEVDTTNLGALSVTQMGEIGGEDIATETYTFFPSIAVNGPGAVAIGFSASGPSIYPGSYYTHREPGDPAGTTSGSGLLRAGTDYYYRTFGATRNRWGDFSGTALDPTDGCFWIYNQHAMARGTGTPPEDGRWATAWGKFCPTAVPVELMSFSAE